MIPNNHSEIRSDTTETTKGPAIDDLHQQHAALSRDADIARLRPEDWLANLIIAGAIDDKAKKELMKIDHPDMEKVRRAANTYEKEQNSLSTPHPRHSKSKQTTQATIKL